MTLTRCQRASNTRYVLQLGLMLLAMCTGMAVMSTAAVARTSCGAVAPRLQPGQGEEDNFYNVTVAFASCGTGRHVALDWLKAGSRYRQTDVDGWLCRGFPVMGASEAHMRCQRHHSIILGYNDGD